LKPGQTILAVPEGTVVVTCGGPGSIPATSKPQGPCPGNGDPNVVNYYLFKHTPELTGKDLNGGGVRADVDQLGSPIVRLSFTGKGDNKFQEVTRRLYQRGQLRNASQPFGVVRDGPIQLGPKIAHTDSSLSDGISGGGEITGIGSQSEANNIATVLRYGALPIPFKRVEQTNVSATLGKSSL